MNTKTQTERIAIIIAAILALTVTPLALIYEQDGLAQTSPAPKQPPLPKEPPPPVPCEASFPRWFCAKAPIATVGANVYIAWNNNDTGHWNVLFVKSNDGGKTFGKNIMLSAPNKGNTVDQNVRIAASGSNVYVTWWTNKTGALIPVFRGSNDNGNTFGKTVTLNSTW